jgi:hydrogenase-4 component B
MNSFQLGLALFVAGGFLALVVRENARSLVMSVLSGAGAALTIIPALKVLFLGGELAWRYSLPAGTVQAAIDPLSAFFIVIISAMSFLGTVYAGGYLRSYEGQGRPTGPHAFFLSLLTVSMLAAVVLRNSLAFLFAWEVMSVSSFFLVTFENEKQEAFDAGLYYLIAMHAGAIFLVGGFLTLAIRSGTFDFSGISSALMKDSRLKDIIFILFFIGFGTKAGFIPLHTWLPKAHPAAPSHVSGIMSGIMIKTGIYGLFRMLSLGGVPSAALSWSVLAVSVASAVLGVLYAIAQHDLKKLLAYHSVENIGIIGIGLGIGMLGLSLHNSAMAALGFAGSLLHVMNHSLFKELLFYGAGAVYLKTHTRNMERLGGLAAKMPVTAGLFLAGSLAISGLPPFNGFISEFLIYMGMFAGLKSQGPALFCGLTASLALLALVGAMALLCFTKAFSVVFLGSPRSSDAEHAVDPGKSMLLPMAVMAVFCVLIGLFPAAAVRLVKQPVLALVPAQASGFENLLFTDLLSSVSAACFLFLSFFFALFLVRAFLLKGKSVRAFKTWDCGYQAGSARMQYTASSFADPFLAVARPFLELKKRLEKPEGLFPKKARFESHAGDYVETYAVRPLAKAIEKALDLFTWIQSGKMQHYILYGLVFLLVSLLWLIGGRS